MDIRNAIDLIESRGKKTLELARLPYAKTALYPVLTERSLDHHYSELAKGYVDRFNAGEGDPAFNEAGAYLHNLYFPQFISPRTPNRPYGSVANLINKKYGDYTSFKEEFIKKAMAIQGSGWIYMSRSGEIKTIKNHAIRTDIVLLIDWWEHAWVDDYGTKKAKYIKDIWRIINWDTVNNRL